ncbi:PhzF family phenazine biosynthesis protein [Reinekea blandensis]|uniref:Phenazine biosynthesis PhzC/PhzF protein n=1 Tax=Reinekea blandensis MED297 TaxID=314283 RepID=A4BCT4_9GAMM|nr:PhzF family phenazine biosynthesis protein [Reinekea blandensis]EAR10016.1 Phenazine biosynthesis PhzC/PhzF protein [Reinekea sp. MED297] [Reinekea blandensis MED297]
MTLTVPIVHAFIDGNQGGNPAGVVLDADRFTTEQKQTIARQIGLSETAFVSRSVCADVKLEFFTPARQIAHCGHATVATFSYLQQQGRLSAKQSSKETIDGCRAIALEGDYAYMAQTAPSFQALNEHQHHQLLESLGLTDADRPTELIPSVVNTGNAFVILAVNNMDTLARLAVDQAGIAQLSEALDLIGVYVYTTETADPQRHASARMFAPRYGILEEAATGMAAGPLACYLYEVAGMTQQHFLIEQGRLMAEPSPSVIDVRLSLASDGHIDHLMAGGRAQVREQRSVELVS